MAKSGVMSTLASPAMPSRPNRLRAPRDSHTMRAVDDGAGLDRLERIDLDAGREQSIFADEAFVAEHDALFGAHAVA